MKKISILLFFLFLVGCQSYPQVSQEPPIPPTSSVEIRNIPYALKNIDYNCI